MIHISLAADVVAESTRLVAVFSMNNPQGLLGAHPNHR